MSAQVELPLSPRIRSVKSKRTIALTSLRPGDWMRGPAGSISFVRQNSARLEKLELEWPTRGATAVKRYDEFDEWTYLGQGRPRAWWRFLPAFLRKIVCPYSRPV
jgi:hypothetical protein